MVFVCWRLLNPEQYARLTHRQRVGKQTTFCFNLRSIRLGKCHVDLITDGKLYWIKSDGRISAGMRLYVCMNSVLLVVHFSKMFI